jgi:hypothetical protein
MLILALVLIAILVIFALFVRHSNSFNTTTAITYTIVPQAPTLPIDTPIDNVAESPHEMSEELKAFEQYYIDSLPVKFKQRNSHFNDYELRPFVDDKNIVIDGLRPFENAEDYSVLLHSLMAYSVRLVKTPNAASLAQRLVSALETIRAKLPSTAPTQTLPWGFDEKYWYVFSVTMPECMMQLCIVLRPYCDVGDIVVGIITEYLNEPNLSLGWRRGIGYTTRMCVPFVYAELLKGGSVSTLAKQRSVAGVLHEVAHEIRETGTGIHDDFVNFVDSNVRNYSFLVDNYFVFDYYNVLFGADFVRFDNIHASLHLIGNDKGIVHPALGYKNGRTIMPALKFIMEYAPGIYSADFSKIVTVRNDNYFATLVCPVNGVAYFQANYDYREHALPWTMTKRIWPHNCIVESSQDNYDTMGVESGVLLLYSDTGRERVPADDVLLSPNTAMSFLPNPGFTAIAVTGDCAAVTSYSKFDALNIEYYSYTVYHRTGMLQLYDRIKTLKPIDRDAACVVMVRDMRLIPDTCDGLVFNGKIAKHHNIINYKRLVNFDGIRVSDDVSYVRQVIDKKEINAGTGTACYSLCTQNDTTTSIVTKLESNRYTFKVVAQNGIIECVFDFPFVVVKNNETRQITINNAYSVSRNVHTIHFEDVRRLLGHVSLSVDNLRADNISRTEFAFIYRNSNSNQFSFVY